MANSIEDANEYWDKRFKDEGKIWGELPSRTAHYALELFRRSDVKRILVPGSGYGRNSKLFSTLGFDVTGIEISEVAHNLAKEFDPLTKFYRGSVLDMSFDAGRYDAIYCFNVLHLFRENERRLLVRECANKLRDKGFMFFTVFSEREPSFGKGKEIENNTFESRPGRPVHYFTEDGLREHFSNFETVKMGMIEEPEDHGGNPHIHILRHILTRKATR